MEKWDWNQKWDCLSFMVHAQVVEKWVLWPQGMQWKREFYGSRALDERKQNSIRLCMITHTYNCALIKHMYTYFGEGPFHVHSWQDQRWQMFSNKTRTCHSYKVNHDTTWIFKHFGLFGKRKEKTDQHNQFFAYELYFGVHVFYIAFLAEYGFCQVKYDA